MFCKLAWKNVTQSIRDYTVYFLTIAFGVCLFYAFNSMDTQAAMIQLSNSQSDILLSLVQMLGVVSVFVAVVLGFLVVYANRFLMKRRKKELGIYLLLGMPKSRVSRIMIFETLLIGMFALAVGLLIGVFLAQGMSVLTARLFETNLKAFYFAFSTDAFIKSIIYFGVIFLTVMVFNTITVSRFKLIDLLTAARKNEQAKMRNLTVSVIAFLLSVACLGVAYYLIFQNGLRSFDERFTASIVLGCIGTLLFFFSLSGFLLRVIQTSKKLYYRNLNMFILRQINSRINTAFVSMTVICLLLFLAISALSVGMGVTNAMTVDIEKTVPVSISMFEYPETGAPSPDMTEELKADGFDLDAQASRYEQIDIYDLQIAFSTFLLDGSPMSDSIRSALEKEGMGFYSVEAMAPAGYYCIEAISVSDYNKMMEMQGRAPISLGEDEFAIFSNLEDVKPLFDYFLQNGGPVTVGGRQLTAGIKESLVSAVYNDVSVNNLATLIVPDSVADILRQDKNLFHQTVLNLNFRSGVTDDSFDEALNAVYGENYEDYPFLYYTTRQSVFDSSVGGKTMISYIVLYLSIVFLITSAAVLALQQLSEASDNIERYRLLRKLGTDSKMVYRSLFIQIAISFILPLILAMVHSCVAISVVGNTANLVGGFDIMSMSLFTAAVFLVVYGGYFFATYLGSRNMIRVKSRKMN